MRPALTAAKQAGTVFT